MSEAIDSVTSTPRFSVSNLGEVSRVPSQVLDQDDFLKLLMAQMTSQDPLNPKKDTDFIAQMAQFSALEQSRAMQSDMAHLRADQQVLQANALIGRHVTVQGSGDNDITGTVLGVLVQDGTPKILVNGVAYDLNQVLRIAAPLPANSNPNSNPSTPCLDLSTPRSVDSVNSKSKSTSLATT